MENLNNNATKPWTNKAEVVLVYIRNNISGKQHDAGRGSPCREHMWTICEPCPGDRSKTKRPGLNKGLKLMEGPGLKLKEGPGERSLHHFVSRAVQFIYVPNVP